MKEFYGQSRLNSMNSFNVKITLSCYYYRKIINYCLYTDNGNHYTANGIIKIFSSKTYFVINILLHILQNIKKKSLTNQTAFKTACCQKSVPEISRQWMK